LILVQVDKKALVFNFGFLGREAAVELDNVHCG
jgi:hypothetical protein